MIVFGIFFLASSLGLSRMCSLAPSCSTSSSSAESLVWHLIVLASVIRVCYLGRWRCDLSSRLKVVARRADSPSTHPCTSPSPYLFFSHFCISRTYPHFLHVILSMERSRRRCIFPLIQNRGLLAGLRPGYPSVLSNSVAMSSLSSRRGFSRLSGLDLLMSCSRSVFLSLSLLVSLSLS